MQLADDDAIACCRRQAVTGCWSPKPRPNAWSRGKPPTYGTAATLQPNATFGIAYRRPRAAIARSRGGGPVHIIRRSGQPSEWSESGT